MKSVLCIVLCLWCMPPEANAQWKQATRIYAGTIRAMASSDSLVFAGTELDGVLVSYNDGLDWQKTGLVNEDVRAVYVSDSLVYAGTFGGKLFRSQDLGASWTEISIGITGDLVKAIIKKGPMLFAGTLNNGIYRSTDEGATWVQSATAAEVLGVHSFAILGDVIAVGCGRGVLRSLDNGNSWTVAAGSQYIGVESLTATGSDFIAGAGLGIYLSADTGATCTRVFSDRATMIAAHDSTVLAYGDHLMLSRDGGNNWQVISTPSEDGYVISIDVSETALYCGTLYGNVFRSTDGGLSWTRVVKAERGAEYLRALTVMGESLYMGTADAVYRAGDHGAAWEKIGGDLSPVYALTSQGTTLLASTYDGVYRLGDRAMQWEPVDSGLTNSRVTLLASAAGTLYAASTMGKGVFRSVDTGSTWQTITFDTPETNYYRTDGLLASGSELYIATMARVFHSTDAGLTFTESYSNRMNYPLSMVKADTNVYIACADDRDEYSEIPHPVMGGISRFQAWNNTWVPWTDDLPTDIVAIASWGKHLFALIKTKGVFASSDRGESWKDVSGNLNPVYGGQLIVWGEDLVVNTGSAIWMRPLSEIITDVHEETNISPQGWHLAQNYPNPFNPSTTIAFSIPKRSHVSLKIFDVMGREVASVVNEELAAGSHHRQWNASGYASGMYFYRLQAGSFTETKRLIVVK